MLAERSSRSASSESPWQTYPGFQIDPFLIFFFCLLGSLLFPIHAHSGGLQWPVVDSPKHWLVDPDSFNLSSDLSFSNTVTNFNNNGEEVSLPQLVSASAFNVRLHGGLPLAAPLSLFGQIDIRNINNEVTAAANQPDNTRFGFGDAFVALRWSFLNTRRLGGRFATAERIDGGTMRLLLESGVVLPLYGESSDGEPDLGDRSMDIQTMLRYAWWLGDDFALSAGAGLVLRNKGYATESHYKLRMDYYFNDGDQFRLWGESFGHFSSASNGGVTSTLAGGSALIGSASSTQHKLGIGGAFHPGKSWEVVAAIHGTLAGERAAKVSSFSIGVAFRPPHEVTTAFYNPKDDMPIGGLARNRVFDRYDIHAPVTRVSRRGNFVKIGYGAKDDVQMGDLFHIFERGGLQKLDRPKKEQFIGLAEVVGLRKDGAFLRIRKSTRSRPIQPGMEARRIRFKDDKALPRVNR